MSGLAIVVLVVLIAVYVTGRHEENVYRGPLAPAIREADGSIFMGRPGAKAPRLEVFEDFQCSLCKEFEKSSGNMIKRLAAEGRVNVWYYPVWVYRQQPEPMMGNSLRAANAALCAPADKWIRYHDVIFRHQPAERSAGFSNGDLIGWAGDLGFDSPAFEQCVTGLRRQRQLEQMTNFARYTRKLAGTPALVLNGRSLHGRSTLLDAKRLEAAILAAAPTQTAPASPPAPPTR